MSNILSNGLNIDQNVTIVNLLEMLDLDMNLTIYKHNESFDRVFGQKYSI